MIYFVLAVTLLICSMMLIYQSGVYDVKEPKNGGTYGIPGVIIFLVALVLLSLGHKAFAADFPLPARVVDQPRLLTPIAVRVIENMTKEHEATTGNQVVLVIVNTLDGLAVEDYAHKLATTWRLGQKGTNNGVLLLVAAKEHKVRIEVGYGLEDKLTDARAKSIIGEMVSFLTHKQWDEGCMKGISSIISTIGTK